jgi:hypothetical protein
MPSRAHDLHRTCLSVAPPERGGRGGGRWRPDAARAGCVRSGDGAGRRRGWRRRRRHAALTRISDLSATLLLPVFEYRHLACDGSDGGAMSMMMRGAHRRATWPSPTAPQDCDAVVAAGDAAQLWNATHCVPCVYRKEKNKFLLCPYS